MKIEYVSSFKKLRFFKMHKSSQFMYMWCVPNIDRNLYFVVQGHCPHFNLSVLSVFWSARLTSMLGLHLKTQKLCNQLCKTQII